MQSRSIIERGLLGLVLVVAVLSSVSCVARTRYLTVRIPQVPPAEAAPLPLHAALVLPDAIRTANEQEQVNCPFSTTYFVFQTGTGFEKGAVQALTQSFSKVDVLRERPKAGQFDLVIEPTAPDIELEGHCALFSGEKPSLDARATVSVNVLDRNDRPLLAASFTSNTHTEERVLDGVGKAMTDLLQAMAHGLSTAPKILSYAGQPVSQPAAQAPAPSPPSHQPTPTPTPSGERHVDVPKRALTPLPMVPTTDEAKTALTGAGFAVGFGYIVTAYHLVAGMSYLTVYHQDRALPAALVLRDRLSDVALLKVDDGSGAQGLGGLRLAESGKVKTGERVWVCDLAAGGGGDKPVWREGRVRSYPGNATPDPRLLPLSLTNGIQYSGGPVLNEQGEVVGITITPADAEQMFPQLSQLASDGAVAVRIQYAKWLLSMLPESEFILPAPAPRSLPVSTLIENARPQVVVLKSAAREVLR
ncbi:S1 family peptidase [Candidatus Nitrospira bockiana]